MDESLPVDFLKLTLSRFDGYYNLATIKASLLVTADGALLAMLLGNSSDYLALLAGTPLAWLSAITFLGIALTTAISAFLAGWVVKAFLDSGVKPAQYWSLLFFGSIAQMDQDTFVANALSLAPENYHKDLAHQIHILAKGLMNKYRLTNWSLLFLGLAILQGSIVAVVKAATTL